MTDQQQLDQVAYSKSAAAQAAGVSERSVQYAIARGDLVAHYLGAKPLILRDDLREWIESLPTERAS